MLRTSRLVKHAFVATAALLAVLLGLSACAPTSTRGLDFDDIDKDFLDSTLLVAVSARHVVSIFPMRGSTVFVGDDNIIRHLDNDGIANIGIASQDGIVAFADENTDYLLGSQKPVRARTKNRTSLTGSAWHEENLVSLLNQGTVDATPEARISNALNPRKDTTVKPRVGVFGELMTCNDGIWALRQPLSNVSKERAFLDRIFPLNGPYYEVTIDTGEIYWDTSSCNGNIVTAFGGGQDGDKSEPMLFRVDISTGTTVIRDVSGIPDSMTAWNISVNDNDVTVLLKENNEQQTHQLWSINPKTGQTALRKTITEKIPDDVSKQLYRVDGPYLYQLSITTDSPSTLRAFDAESGELVKERTFDALWPIINNPRGFDDALESYNDFVVLTPVDEW